MKIEEMNLQEVEERLASLTAEVEEMTEVESVEHATEEKRSLLARKEELLEVERREAEIRRAEAEAEERRKMAEAIESGSVRTNEIPLNTQEERKMENIEIIATKEYRDAFYANLAGKATPEQRAVLATPLSVDGNGTDDGTALALPKTLDEKIWDNIHTDHPILNDIQMLNTGIVMEITRHVGMTARVAAKKDAAQGAGPEENTFVKVTLAGKDYEKYVELTYAQATMSQGALEDYLAEEIAAELGEALAKDVVAQIIADATTGQKVTATNDMFADLKAALGKANMAARPVVYAPSAKYFELIGFAGQGGPVNLGEKLGVEIKKDDAFTDVVVVDPRMFVLNVIQGVMIESDRDIKNHRIVVAGYMRAEGALRKTKAAAYIG